MKKAAELKTIVAACPRCHTTLSKISSSSCKTCGLGWHRNGHAIVWDEPTFVQDAPSLPGGWLTRQWQRACNLLANTFHPLRNPYSPLVRLSRCRVEEYYRRTLEEPDLADAWRSRYLKGLDLSNQPVLLDHGCGRGRLVALAVKSGFVAGGQDIAVNPWWDRLPTASFQALPPSHERLPWGDAQFDVACDFQVLGHLTPQALGGLFSEMFRVLHPGGIWIIQEANNRGFAARITRRYYGRLYTLEEIIHLAKANGFEVVDHWYEGFQAPLLPLTFNYLRKVVLSRRLDLDDGNSKLAAMLPPHLRRLWVLRLRRHKS